MSIDFLDFVRIRPRANSIYTQANLSRIRESPCHAPKVVSQRVTTHLMAAAKAASRESEEVTNASHSCSTGIPAAATAGEDSCCCYCHCRYGCCGCETRAAGGRPPATGEGRQARARACMQVKWMDGYRNGRMAVPVRKSYTHSTHVPLHPHKSHQARQRSSVENPPRIKTSKDTPEKDQESSSVIKDV